MVLLFKRNKTYFGTTDTDYQGDFTDPKVTQEDVDYLLDVINHRYRSKYHIERYRSWLDFVHC